MIRIRILLLSLLFTGIFRAEAQSELIVQGATPDLYLNHTVVAKETWYSLGRMYNISPKKMATYNGLSMARPLNIDQVVKIPLISAANFIQNDSKRPDEILIPLYHIIQDREWMYRISVNHNKVPVEKLEKWNNITPEEAKAGIHLIVGFLKVKEGQSSLTGGQMQRNATTTAATSANHTTPDIKATSQDIPKETPKQEAAKETRTATAVNFKGGYFSSQYNDRGKSASGISGIFKSSSGWKDGKYYALMNNVSVGTIVKVSSASTNKTIYAKVLGELPEMRESIGLTIRISDAAAKELGADNTRFGVDLNY